MLYIKLSSTHKRSSNDAMYLPEYFMDYYHILKIVTADDDTGTVNIDSRMPSARYWYITESYVRIWGEIIRVATASHCSYNLLIPVIPT